MALFTLVDYRQREIVIAAKSSLRQQFVTNVRSARILLLDDLSLNLK